MFDLMRIAYLLANFPSVTESFTLREIKSLQRSGIDIDVLAAKKGTCFNSSYEVTAHYRPARVSWPSILSGIKLCVLRPIRFTKLMMYALRLLFVSPLEFLSLLANIHTVYDYTLYLEKHNIKHLHAYFLSWPSLVAVGIKIISDLTISLSAHSRDIYVEGGDIAGKVRAAEFVTVCTKAGIEMLKTSVAKSLHSKLLLSYHGLDLNDIPACHTKPGGFEIVAAGRLVPKKGYYVLLSAFAKIRKRCPNITLKIIGGGKLHSQICRYLKDNQLKDSVFLMGWQDHDCVMDAISKAGLLVVSSIKAEDGDIDGIPNVILEAFSTMTPVVASELNSMSEAIVHGVNGYLFKAGDSDDLAEKIEELYNSDSLRNRLTVHAREVLVKKFNIDMNMIDKIKLFKKCQCDQ